MNALSGLSAHGDATDILAAQRKLRERLLDRASIRHARARDLAAHMLLNLEDLSACWSLATHWLRQELECDRVDTGFGQARERTYLPGYAEAKNADYDIPSFGGAVVFNFDPAMQAMWHSSRPLIFADIKRDRRVSAYLRDRMSGARTRSKFGAALRDGKGGFGLICADWTERGVPHRADLYDAFEQTVVDVLGPIIGVAKEIARAGAGRNREPTPETRPSADTTPAGAMLTLGTLTTSELEIARLVARGMSYKEIARVRDRSFSTIDHQLRSIRQKTGASSTAALVSLLAKIDALH